MKDQAIVAPDFEKLMQSLLLFRAIKKIEFKPNVVNSLNRIANSKDYDPETHAVLQNCFHGAVFTEAEVERKTNPDLKDWIKFKPDTTKDDSWTEEEKHDAVEDEIADEQEKKSKAKKSNNKKRKKDSQKSTSSKKRKRRQKRVKLWG